MEIRLTQIEKSDGNKLKEIFSQDMMGLWGVPTPCSRSDVDNWIMQQFNSDSFCFAIRCSKDMYKNFLVGVCAINHMDMAARHGQLVFSMPGGLDGSPEFGTEEISAAFQILLKTAFKELNLNKVWIELASDKTLEQVLENIGFVAEGVRRSSFFYNGKFLDSVVFSLLGSEYK